MQKVGCMHEEIWGPEKKLQLFYYFILIFKGDYSIKGIRMKGIKWYEIPLNINLEHHSHRIYRPPHFQNSLISDSSWKCHTYDDAGLHVLGCRVDILGTNITPTKFKCRRWHCNCGREITVGRLWLLPLHPQLSWRSSFRDHCQFKVQGPVIWRLVHRNHLKKRQFIACSLFHFYSPEK